MAKTRKNFISSDERETLITLANTFLANPKNTQEQKEDIFWKTSHLLSSLNCYNGYNWTRWAKGGGASKYFEDYPDKSEMSAEDYKIRSQEQYMGLEWDRFFY